MTTITIGVFTGGKNSVQYEPFIGAVQALQLVAPLFEIEYITVTDVKDNFDGCCRRLVDHMLQKDVHVFISHPHQGTSHYSEEQMGWEMDTLEAELWRLHDHPGFPSGDSLRCPIFLQNKYEYLRPLQHLRCVNQTLNIPLKEDDDYSNIEKELRYDFFVCHLSIC